MDYNRLTDKSRPVWGAWIEIQRTENQLPTTRKSRPVWGAWIEITTVARRDWRSAVAPRMGRVD